MAWLHEILPLPPNSNKDAKPKSRLESLNDGHIHKRLPEVAAFYLIDELNRIGFVSQGANGVCAISWQDVAAYQSQNYNLLSPWECGVLIDMSREYVRQYNSKQVEPPYIDDDEDAINEHMKEQVKIMKSAIRLSAKAP